jgi:sterol desaturase/sphingolipid hydroxylase (fatty acid hydroxylase superfamily)
MPDAFLLVAALVCTVIGMGWLALAMDVHWNQVRPTRRSPRTATILRVLGSASLGVSLLLCLLADTATMAVLVWMMLLSVSAAAIALVLSRQPRMLSPLVAWTHRSAN